MFDTHDKGERSRKAYREGAEASKSSGFWGHFFHEFDDAAKPFFPQSAESKARDAGWHDYSDKKYRYKRRKKHGRSSGSSSSSSSSSDSSSFGFVVLIAIAVVIAVIVWLGSLPINKHQQQKQEVWTMRRVKATKLNIRSAPGVQSSIVATFERGWRIAVTGEPVQEGNTSWVRVSSDDGKIQGWAAQNFIDYGPYDQNVETVAGQEKTEAPATPATDSKPEAETKVVSDEPQNSATPAPTATPNPNITVSPNVRIVSDEPARDEPSDGIPRLKRRDPVPESESNPRLKKRDPVPESESMPRLKRRDDP